MKRLSRRKAMGAGAASLSLLTGKLWAGEQSTALRGNGAESMTLEEFQALNGRGSVARLIGKLDCGTLAMCHRRLGEKEGIWIPELQPIFEKLDAMAAR